ncbi:hypothetical protein R3P38DRAFT_3238625 [Favolaschia claudopus]|uniref:Uncharacterized protein n=1 Tax=Favolaschia claudopus TaxID=2862362 RepID=A0AAV9Z9B0_9AGAR
MDSPLSNPCRALVKYTELLPGSPRALPVERSERYNALDWGCSDWNIEKQARLIKMYLFVDRPLSIRAINTAASGLSVPFKSFSTPSARFPWSWCDGNTCETKWAMSNNFPISGLKEMGAGRRYDNLLHGSSEWNIEKQARLIKIYLFVDRPLSIRNTSVPFKSFSTPSARFPWSWCDGNTCETEWAMSNDFPISGLKEMGAGRRYDNLLHDSSEWDRKKAAHLLAVSGRTPGENTCRALVKYVPRRYDQ